MKLIIDVPKVDLTDLEDLQAASWKCLSWHSKQVHAAMIGSVEAYQEPKPRTGPFDPIESYDEMRHRLRKQAQQEYGLLPR
jgi:hypothetical protein